jgi:hypothetical protein
MKNNIENKGESSNMSQNPGSIVSKICKRLFPDPELNKPYYSYDKKQILPPQ